MGLEKIYERIGRCCYILLLYYIYKFLDIKLNKFSPFFSVILFFCWNISISTNPFQIHFDTITQVFSDIPGLEILLFFVWDIYEKNPLRSIVLCIVYGLIYDQRSLFRFIYQNITLVLYFFFFFVHSTLTKSNIKKEKRLFNVIAKIVCAQYKSNFQFSIGNSIKLS